MTNVVSDRYAYFLFRLYIIGILRNDISLYFLYLQFPRSCEQTILFSLLNHSRVSETEFAPLFFFSSSFSKDDTYS